MNFITRLLILINIKIKVYNSILVIMNYLMIIIHYESVKVIIIDLSLVDIIIEVVI